MTSPIISSPHLCKETGSSNASLAATGPSARVADLRPWPGFSAMHNNVPHLSAAGNFRCSKCGKKTLFGAHGRCLGGAS